MESDGRGGGVPGRAFQRARRVEGSVVLFAGPLLVSAMLAFAASGCGEPATESASPVVAPTPGPVAPDPVDDADSEPDDGLEDSRRLRDAHAARVRELIEESRANEDAMKREEDEESSRRLTREQERILTELDHELSELERLNLEISDEEHRIWLDTEQARLEPALGAITTSCDFTATPVLEVLRFFEERHGVTLAVDESVRADVESVTVTLHFEEVHLARVLAIVGAVSGMRLEPEGKGVRFTALPQEPAQPDDEER